MVTIPRLWPLSPCGGHSPLVDGDPQPWDHLHPQAAPSGQGDVVVGHFHKGTSRFPPLLSVPALHVLLLCPKSPHREDDIGLTKPPSGH